jgi:hypothetical protein
MYRVCETPCLGSIHRFFPQKHTYILAYLKGANFSEQILQRKKFAIFFR